jgi:hypothetical protein
MALKFLSETEQHLLDGRLQSLLQTLTKQPPEPDGTVVGEARGIIESQVGKLIRPSWEATWEAGYLGDGHHRKGFVASAWFEVKHKEDATGRINRVPEFEKEADELYTVFTRLVAYIKETDADDRQDAVTNLKKALRRYLRLRGYNVESSAAATGPAAGSQVATATPADLPQLLSATDLAARLRQPPDRVETFLRRRRASHPDCYIEGDNPRKNEPRYLYRVADVWPALQKQLSKWSSLTDG